MKKINKNTLVLLERIARKGVVKTENSSFPTCFGFFHQPVRPKKKVIYKETLEE
ncbi:MAG: cyclic lactone autoinducer peptide [Lachnospiraceae bacterium]|nr:cyclic lactone autoinducer peptide [Lachnospiraceae bacterium]